MVLQKNRYMRISDIDDLEKEILKYDKVSIFPAGEYGKTWAYDIVNSACPQGIYCYFDNKVEVGTIINGSVCVKEIGELYKADNILIILAVGFKLRDILLNQLEENGVENIIIADEIFLTDIGRSIENLSEERKKRYKTFIDTKLFLTNIYNFYYHKNLDFDNPKSFNDKINWLKVNNIELAYSKLVDKLEVKEYVSQIIGKDYVIPTLTSGNSLEEININKLPNQFVIKCTHDSGSTFMITDKSQLKDNKIKDTLDYRLKVNPYYLRREYVYKNVKPRIIIEKLILNETGDINKNISDYKFFCYDGEPRFIFVATGREKGHMGMKIDFFDADFNHVPVEHKLYPNAEVTPKKPNNFNKMKELVKKLATGIRFVRIDMYCEGDSIYFGEFTFFPGGGMEEYPEILGNDIRI